MKVFKYRLHVMAREWIDMPTGTRALTVQLQDGYPCLWALCDEQAPLESRLFIVVGTGCPVPPEAGDYLGTWQQNGYVWHLFGAAS